MFKIQGLIVDFRRCKKTWKKNKYYHQKWWSGVIKISDRGVTKIRDTTITNFSDREVMVND